MALRGLGQPFGGASQLINVGAPAGIEQALAIQQQGLDRLGAAGGSFVRKRKEDKQHESDQQKFRKALGILRTGNGSPESQTQAVDVLSTVETPGYADFVKQLNANLIAKEMDTMGQQQAQAKLALTKAQTGKTEAEGSAVNILRNLHRDRNAAINAGNERGEEFLDGLIAVAEKRIEDDRRAAIPTDPRSLTVHDPADSKGVSPFKKKASRPIMAIDKVAPDALKEIRAAAQDGTLTADEVKSIEAGLTKDPTKVDQVLELIRKRKGL
jgi:hypothetical protein